MPQRYSTGVLAISLVCAASFLGSQASSQEDHPGAQPIPGTVVLAYARDYQLEMLVGQYDPRTRRWYGNTYPFIPPRAEAPFTLFGVTGRLASVRLDDPYAAPADIDPWEWDANIKPWDRRVTRVALALPGAWPDTERHAEVLPRNDPDAAAAVAAFLKGRGLDVPQPRVTQVLRVDLNGDGRTELLICANTDNAALTEAAPAAIYHLALLRLSIDGAPKTLPLRVAVSFKPAHRSVDEHQRYYGRAAFYQVLAITDVARDGQEQVAILNDDRNYGPEVDLYALTGHAVKRLLATQMLFF